jgi:hypothetical protein
MVRQEPKLSKFIRAKVQGNLFAEIEPGYKHEKNVSILWSSPSQVDKVVKALGIEAESTSEKILSKYQLVFHVS